MLRYHLMHDSIWQYTLTLYMQALTKVRKSMINSFIPDKIAAVFNGWTGGDNQIVAVLLLVLPLATQHFFTSYLTLLHSLQRYFQR